LSNLFFSFNSQVSHFSLFVTVRVMRTYHSVVSMHSYFVLIERTCWSEVIRLNIVFTQLNKSEIHDLHLYLWFFFIIKNN